MRALCRISVLASFMLLFSVQRLTFFCFRKIQPGTLCMDSSTIDPDVSRAIAGEAKSKNTIYLDSPVSGGKIFPISNIYFITFLLLQVWQLLKAPYWRLWSAATKAVTRKQCQYWNVWARILFIAAHRGTAKRRKFATTCCWRFAWSEHRKRSI